MILPSTPIFEEVVIHRPTVSGGRVLWAEGEPIVGWVQLDMPPNYFLWLPSTPTLPAPLATDSMVVEGQNRKDRAVFWTLINHEYTYYGTDYEAAFGSVSLSVSAPP